MKTRIFSFFFLFLPLLVGLFAFPLRAEEPMSDKEKQEAISHFFSLVLVVQKPKRDMTTFLKERREDMFTTAEKILAWENSNRDRYLYDAFNFVRRYYPDADAETQQSALKEAEAFFEKYRKNEQDSQACENCLEALRVLPIVTKLEKTTESSPWSERKQLLDELYQTLEPLKIGQKNPISSMIVSLVLDKAKEIDQQLENRVAQKEMLPFLESFSKLLETKDHPAMKLLAWRCRQRQLRIESEGKPCPWDEISFTDLDGKERKIADFRGKPLVLAFFPLVAPNVELLKDCAEHWHSQNLQILLITTRFSDAKMKKFVEVCGVPFPVWNVQTSGTPKELSDSLPPHWCLSPEGAMLIDADGKVVNAYIGYDNLVAELGKFYGVVADDPELKIVQKKAERFFHIEVPRQKLLDIPEDATPEQMYRRFQAVLTNLMTPPRILLNPYYDRLGTIMHPSAAQLFDLADYIAERTEDRKMIESMYDGMLFLAQNQLPYTDSQLPDFAATLLEKVKQHDLPKIAAESQIIDFTNRLQKLASSRPGNYSESLVELCTTIFNLVRESKGDYDPSSISELFTHLGRAIRNRGNEVQSEIYLEMANVLNDLNDPALKNTAELYRGVATRLSLLGKEAPIEGETLDGKVFDPELYKSKVVLIDFWATWCGPCLAEIPNMKKMYEKYHEKGFEIVSISTDRELDDLKEFLEEKPLPWICLADELAVKSGKTPMKRRYGVQYIPTMFLVGQDGRVILLEARGEKLEEKLAEIFD